MKMRVYQTVEEHFDINIPDGLTEKAQAVAVDEAISEFDYKRIVFDQVVARELEVLPA